jgi:hypothetical protein
MRACRRDPALLRLREGWLDSRSGDEAYCLKDFRYPVLLTVLLLKLL